MISAVILAKNEEQNIEKCLESVKWCDEIIVVDDNSSDSTSEIANKYKAVVYPHPLENNFSTQRNFGLSKAKGDWIFFVDSDEVVSDELAYEIEHVIGIKNQNLNNYNGFYTKRTDFMWGKQLRYGETGGIKLLRLAKKDAGKWEGLVHERWIINGRIGELANPLFHFPHSNLTELLEEINFYTDLRARELKDNNAMVYFWSIFLFPLGKFSLNYFIKRGFLDGLRGLIFAIIMSFHSFLVRGKLWTLQEKVVK
ncbi:MAG: glycosyltransferase family 2 protein [bacterium]|nr:glycosyltransferase family 2 protein [bacterium]